MNLKPIFTSFFAVLQCLVLFAQPQEDTPPASYIEKMVPSSPTVAAMGKFGDVPVNYSNGLPSIEIPLMEVKGRELTQPLTMAYHAGGVKIEEAAGWVGMSWNLTAGGMITRSPMGLPDESGSGYLYQNYLMNEQVLFSDENSCEYLENLSKGNEDTQPDIFVFNFGPYSGKFYHSSAQKGFTVIPFQPFQIMASKVSSNPHGYAAFCIVAPDGTQYLFGDPADGTTAVEFTTTHSSQSNRSYNSTWFLTHIISANLTDTIRFSYSENHTYCNSRSESKSCFLYEIPGPGPGPMGSCGGTQGVCENIIHYEYSTVHADSWDLDQIKTCNTTVKFHKSPREDLFSDQDHTGYRLDSITVYSARNASQNEIPESRFLFTYSYRSKTPNSNNYLDKRLFLEEITEVGFAGTPSNPSQVIRQTKPPHQFSYYHADDLPDRESYQQDHWGYFNAASNSTLIPEMYYDGNYWDGADRNTNPETSFYGVMDTIVYPTGGFTSFVFEANVARLEPPRVIYTEIRESIGTYGQQCGNTDCEDPPNSCCRTASKIFTVPVADQNAFLTIELPDADDLQIVHGCFPYVWIEEEGVPSSRIEFMPTAQGTTQIIPFAISNTCDYRIGAVACLQESITAFIELTYHLPTDTIYEEYAGGARIGKITDNSGNTPVIRRFRYIDVTNPERTSGFLNMKPCYG